MDWPLSREEKKRHVLQLYDREQQMSDLEIMSGQAALTRLKKELEAFKDEKRSLVEQQQEACRLWHAVEAASAVFRAVVPSANAMEEEDCSDGEQCARTKSRSLAKSAEPLRTVAENQPPQARQQLPRTPRTSLRGTRGEAEIQAKPKRRVSFGKESQTEPSTEPMEPEVYEESKRAEFHSQQEQVKPHSDDHSDTETGEPEPEESADRAKSEPESTIRVESTASETNIREWGLTEFCVPCGTGKVGMHFRHLPPQPLTVQKVTTGSWAELQGIGHGDVVYAIAGRRSDGLTAEMFVRLMQNRPLKLIIERIPRAN